MGLSKDQMIVVAIGLRNNYKICISIDKIIDLDTGNKITNQNMNIKEHFRHIDLLLFDSALILRSINER